MTKNKIAILSGVMLAMLLASLDQTIVSTALPTIVQELHGIEHISWVFTAYMLGSTVTVPIYGKLSDLFGRRKLYLLGIVIFLIASILCGLAQTMDQLIIFRGLQGIGGSISSRRTRKIPGTHRGCIWFEQYSRAFIGRMDHRPHFLALGVLCEHPAGHHRHIGSRFCFTKDRFTRT